MNKQIIERFFLLRFTPDQAQMDALLGATRSLLRQLENKVKARLVPSPVLTSLQTVFKAKESQWEYEPNGPIEGKNGIKWDKVDKDEKADFYWEINAIHKALLGLRAPDLRTGAIILMVLVLLLGGSAWMYIHYHPMGGNAGPTGRTLSDLSEVKSLLVQAQKETGMVDDEGAPNWGLLATQYSEAERRLRGLEMSSLPTEQLAAFKEGIHTKDLPKVHEAINRLQHRIDEEVKLIQKKEDIRLVAVYTQLARLSAMVAGLNDPGDANWNVVRKAGDVLRDELLELRVDHGTQRLLGNLRSSIGTNDQSEVQKAIKVLGDRLQTDFENRQEKFFYTKSPYRWLEIAVWSWFGVLVGVIFYVAKQLKSGLFDRQDVPSIIGEIVIAPIVTCVIFFLFSATGITEFSPTDDSILIILGFAFLFGYAIRRTVGLLENIKQRVLPTP